MAAASSAIGLGNLWKFPYMTGMNGGAIFLIIYLVFIILLGIPILLSEMAIGRNTQLNPLGAYKKINKKWSFVGAIGILCSFIILSYYSVIGGWVIKYIVSFISGSKIKDSFTYFENFVSQPLEPILWHLLFMIITVSIVTFGISKGIERISKIFLPALLFLILIVAIKSLSLPNSNEGLKFFIVPNFKGINSFNDFLNICLHAMGQVFFSLSLGMGALITYGSYLSKDTNLKKSAIIIPLLDTLFAILAGLAILPAVFAFGYKPQSGPGLIFQVLPAVFNSMNFGIIFGFMFFLVVFFAAITSSISLLEVVASFCIDTFKWSRRKSTFLPAFIMFLIGTFASLSFGPLKNTTLLNMNVFDIATFLSDKILMPLGGLFMCLFVGYVWGIKNISNEITNNGKLSFRLEPVFSILIKYIAPALILIIFITTLF
jgi:NSS family neurotransmitter:Na+ symporter